MNLKDRYNQNILTVYALYYFRALLINQKIMAITTTTRITPIHTPALKISPIAWQLLAVKTTIINNE